MMPSAAARIWPRVYNALWYPILPFALLAAGGYHSRNLRERLGRIGFRENIDVNASMRMWVHAASVGEIEAVRPILAGLSRSIADSLVAVTTMTASGRDAAVRRLGNIAAAQLSPLDCAAIVRRFLDQLRPHLVIVAETELWPNLFIQSADSGAKV